MYNTIAESKKAYKEAYAWGLKVQRACLLKKVDLTLVAGYCDANYCESSLAAFTVAVRIWDYENGRHISAEWASFKDPLDFEIGKEDVLAYLEEKGIIIK